MGVFKCKSPKTSKPKPHVVGNLTPEACAHRPLVDGWVINHAVSRSERIRIWSDVLVASLRGGASYDVASHNADKAIRQLANRLKGGEL